MSAVPPNFAASVLQSHPAQRQVSVVRDLEHNQRVSAERQQARAVDQADSTVETADDTTQIHTDSEGAGSQGRAFSSPDEQPKQDTAPVEAEHEDDDEQGRFIDLSA